jgi:spore germination cell wall hydrolase CwlJ-like protein
MTRPEITGKKSSPDADDGTTDALSVSQFCKRHNFSVQMFYKYPDEMPPSFRIGTRRLITREDAKLWREQRAREKAAQ